MSLAVQKAFVGARGIDTIATLTEADVQGLRPKYDFVARYVEQLTVGEVELITAAGLGLVTVSFSRAVGWMPDASLGTTDGDAHVRKLEQLGIPKGTHTFLDLEGMGGTAADTIAFAEAWGAVVEAAGYIPGVYVGAGIPLTGVQLYALNHIHAYWHSCSEVPEVSTCGYVMYQLFPPDQIITVGTTTLEVDIDMIQGDRLGRSLVWTVAA
jgi:hypothetical protein